jgi:predicted nucleic acid-binding protein
MRAILDTSVLLSAEVPPIDADLSISVASLAELHFGVLVARDAGRRAERLRRLTLIERHFSALPIDDAVARSYGQLAAAVTAFGRQPRARVMDLLIAATARTHDAVLYTWNPGDLAGLGDLVEIRTPAT